MWKTLKSHILTAFMIPKHIHTDSSSDAAALTDLLCLQDARALAHCSAIIHQQRDKSVRVGDNYIHIILICHPTTHSIMLSVQVLNDAPSGQTKPGGF